ncbi:TetR family transcriptional regulator [Streptomyces sp. NBC_00201]|uniref:TetR family transcriptional regulator n=1 Tax=unclassified Streptomyces TaxID=2593676 RepID=UPI0022548338|nr:MULTISPECIES: TetR family transcriptional regulator [unclassified Streptomyces]MCX5059678.1 TetR family transcriptional regulator [Streptomyces sp. NBC_00452]MCX5243673.1 TetR family transcriptional regulator [Streptomyces sp. NBC_00201]MCX5290592.1 TetR family transcriptional regulator [Streptomyces sp. NBC_00183]
MIFPFDLAGATVPADALHAQRGHARFLVEDKQAHYALTVKKNQAGLYERLHSLPDKAAARAGVGKATVYRRWRSRAELAARRIWASRAGSRGGPEAPGGRRSRALGSGMPALFSH